MASISFKINANDIQSAVRNNVEGPLIDLEKNPEVLHSIAQEALNIVTPYVPKKSGDLRASGHVVQNSRGTYIVWGDPGVGKTIDYAEYQHNADDSYWRRTTPGTKSYWTEELEKGSPEFEELIAFATPLVKKEVQKSRKFGGRIRSFFSRIFKR